MAKFERTIRGPLSEFVSYLHQNQNHLGATISLEDLSEYSLGDVDVAVYVFERFSYTGSSRVSLNVTLVGNKDNVVVTAISSGGSQAVFFKVNTWGEGAFLDKFIDLVNNY